MRLVLALARSVWRSHKSGYRAEAETRAPLALLARLERKAPADTLTIKAPEGFTATTLFIRELRGGCRGGRGPPNPPARHRHTDHRPSARRHGGGGIRRTLDAPRRSSGRPAIRAASGAGAAACASSDPSAGAPGGGIVDEGPGLSGSSFGAVLNGLESSGWLESRIRLFPLTTASGPCASARNGPVAADGAPPRHLDELFAGRGVPPAFAPGFFKEPLTGPGAGLPEDIAAGRWRTHLFRSPAAWPPVWGWRERRDSCCARRMGPSWPASPGSARADAPSNPAQGRSRRRGLAPRSPDGPRISRAAVAGRRPAALDLPGGGPRSRLFGILGDYLAYRAVALPANREHGATPPILHEMVVANAAEALGEQAARRLRRFERCLDNLARVNRPVQVDGRLHLGSG